MIRNTTRLFAATIAAAVALPTAAFAEPKPAATTIASAATAEVGAAAVDPKKKVCIAVAMTGSLMKQRECRTMEAWLASGVNPRKVK